jgi:putative glutamine amidotransferase
LKPLIGIPGDTQVEGDSVRYLAYASYVRAVHRAGGAPIMIPLGLDKDTLRTIFSRLDGLLIQGGEDVHPNEYGEKLESFCGKIDPDRDATELVMLRWAFEKNLPTLGICRGIQMMNVAAGGTLYQDIDSQMPGSLHHPHINGNPADFRAHSITIEPSSRLANAVGTTEIQVNSRHHQAVKALAKGFQIIARSSDGIIEAMESTNGHFALGVQFHPENMIDSDIRMLGIFRTFVEAIEHQDRSDA